jgi:hypothetical protein
VTAETQLRAELARVERAGWVLDRCLWTVAGIAMVFTCVNVTLFAVDHGVPPAVAWLLDPIAAAALLAALLGDAVLGRHGAKSGRWGAALRLTAGLATWAMNVWQSVWAAPDSAPYAGTRAAGGLRFDPDPAGIVLDSVPPMLLVPLAEAAPVYRQRFTEITDRLRARLDRATAASTAVPAPGARPGTGPARPVPAAGTDRRAARGGTDRGTDRGGTAGTDDRLPAELVERARQVDAKHRQGNDGRRATKEVLRTELGIGSARAVALLRTLANESEPGGDRPATRSTAVRAATEPGTSTPDTPSTEANAARRGLVLVSTSNASEDDADATEVRQ